MNFEEKSLKTRAHKTRVALLFGLFAGLGYSMVAWGYDAYRLARAHAVLPWLQFALGALIFGLIGLLAAWLVYRFNNVLLSFVIWLAAGILFARLAVPVQFQISERILRALLPAFTENLAYPILPAIQARLGLATVFVCILAVIAGMLSVTLIESSAEAGSPVSALIPLLIWIVMFGVAGYAIRDNFTALLSNAVTGADEWIQFAADAQVTPVDTQTAKQMRLRSAEPIKDLLARPRRLLMIGYNDWINSMQVLVMFGDTPVTCMVVEGMVNYCERSP